MTGLEFQARGLAIVWDGRGNPKLFGPPGSRDELADDLAFEISMRMGLRDVRKPQPYRCDHCGDVVGHGVVCPESCPFPGTGLACRFLYGGTCFLCELTGRSAEAIRRGLGL